MGYSRAMLEKPVVGIAYTASGFNNCHRHFPELLEAVKRGVLAAGALPIEFPTISLGEVFLNPTSMKFRNLMAMDTEEMIRGPADGRRRADGRLRQDRAGAADGRGVGRTAGGPAGRRADDDRPPPRRAARRLHRLPPLLGAVSRRQGRRARKSTTIEGKLATTAGTCAVMGTASTMACLAEALGMMLPGTAAIPAVHADRLRAAEATGARRGQADRHDGYARASIITRKSVENALRVLLALGGSTNAIIHLTAIAGRPAMPMSLATAQRIVRRPRRCWSNLKPAGNGYMEDFFAAGGVGARDARIARRCCISTA